MHLYQKHQILILDGIPCENEYVQHDKLYLPCHGLKKSLRKLHEHIPFPGKSYWYGSWKENVEKYDTFIIFDGIRGKDIIEYIYEKNPTARIIIYYINRFRRGAKNDPEKFKNMPCELWSFDKGDCEREGMRHNVFCYNYVFLDKSNAQAFENRSLHGDEIYDAFFIGVDKNRLTRLLALEDLLWKYDYTTKFMLQKAPRGTYENSSEQERELLIDKGISYHEIIKLISQSKCIVELQEQGQTGLTLRAMEALFFQKKLLTDNLEILNCDFYRQENIFVWGQDDECRLADFLQVPYQKVSEEAVSQYTWEAWLDRFFATAHKKSI